uniref:CSON013442 protein n=1 Tax=Culicoides sonorensis TaxID=179676 RepID=A0A336M8C5_CULSO
MRNFNPYSLLLLILLILETYQSKIKITKSFDRNNSIDMEKLKDLYSKINKRDAKNVTTVAMLMGTISTENKMKENLYNILNDVKNNVNNTDLTDNKHKIKRIEYIIKRDRKALDLLYKIIMSGLNQNVSQIENETFEMPLELKEVKDILDIHSYMNHLEKRIDQHLEGMRHNRKKIVDVTMEYFKSTEKKKKESEIKIFNEKSPKVLNSNVVDKVPNQIDAQTYLITPSIYPLLFHQYNDWIYSTNMKRINKRKEDTKEDDVEEFENQEKKEKENENQIEEEESESESSEESSGPGGLAGLIASLSGGDMGSDVGALLGAVSGVVTNIFGPDGLDIESLISTGTGLIGGLLGADENVGKVFSNYLGAALEGLSGGGGADNNGLFIGNFLGGTLAKLSADPDDEDAPIRPDIFLDNFAKGLNEGLGKSSDDREGESHGSDSFSFIGKIISSAVAGIVNLIVQAILGSIGGSSEGSAGLSGSSSEISKGSSSHHHADLKPPAETQGGYY